MARTSSEVNRDLTILSRALSVARQAAKANNNRRRGRSVERARKVVWSRNFYKISTATFTPPSLWNAAGDPRAAGCGDASGREVDHACHTKLSSRRG